MATAVLLLLGCAGLVTAAGAIITAVALPRSPEALETDHGFYMLDKPTEAPTAANVTERPSRGQRAARTRPSDFKGMSLHPL